MPRVQILTLMLQILEGFEPTAVSFAVKWSLTTGLPRPYVDSVKNLVLKRMK